MTKQIFAVAAALVLTTLAPAQVHAQQVSQAKIPFAFQAGDTKMPAGEYRITRPLPDTQSIQQIRRSDSAAATLVHVNAVDLSDNDTEAKLVFHCYTGECFLSEIWVGDGRGLELEQSNREKELSQSKAENELAVVSLPLSIAR